MLYLTRPPRPESVVRPALEIIAEGAGRAWACAFSSSEEYDAAVIAQRRAEGRYRPHRRRRVVAVVVTIVLALGVVAALIV